MVLESDTFSYIQLPFNMQKTDFEGIIQEAHVKGKIVVVNRPFNMGALVSEQMQDVEAQRVQAYRAVAQQLTHGDVILTGTKSPTHLAENVTAFRQASRRGR